jgi:isopentenyl diphosphate isomerase/L-lactate dehydrogenase-like FMN-dependent dehydrogenase
MMPGGPTGAAAVVVSNHGGGNSTVGAGHVAHCRGAAVAGRAEVLIDGGVRRGADAVKALCLGRGPYWRAAPMVMASARRGETGALAPWISCVLISNELKLLGCARFGI